MRMHSLLPDTGPNSAQCINSVLQSLSAAECQLPGRPRELHISCPVRLMHDNADLSTLLLCQQTDRGILAPHGLCLQLQLDGNVNGR